MKRTATPGKATRGRDAGDPTWTDDEVIDLREPSSTDPTGTAHGLMSIVVDRAFELDDGADLRERLDEDVPV